MKNDDIEFAAKIWRDNDSAVGLKQKIDYVTDENWSGATAWAPKDNKAAARGLMAHMFMWAWQWAEDGFWSFSTPHTYAAAMMATRCDGLEQSLSAPGRAMRFNVPQGILSDGVYDYRYCYTLDMPGMCSVTISEGPITTPVGQATNFSIISREAVGISDLLYKGVDLDVVTTTTITKPEFKFRVMLMARRMVIGILYTLQNTTNWKERRGSVGSVGSHREPPDHRCVVAGSPLKIDARPQIRSWLRGGSPHQHGAPSLQHIVRGHYKRQAVGEGRTNRKVIWVEPYWRGPEDAPILIHERVVGS